MRGVTIRYYAYRATVSVGFTAPVWYLYLIETTSFGIAGVLQAIWWIGLVVFPVVVAAALILIAPAPVVAFPSFFLARGGRQLTTTLAGQYLNDRLASAGRATVLSGLGMAISLGGAAVQLSAGWLAGRLGPVTALAVFGLALAVLVVVVRATDRPFDGTPAFSRAD